MIQYVNWPQFYIFYCMRFGSLIQTYFCSTVQECLAHSQGSVKTTSLYSSFWNDHKYLQSGSSLYRQLWVHRAIGGLKRIKRWGAQDLFICFQKWIARPSQGVDNTCRTVVSCSSSMNMLGITWILFLMLFVATTFFNMLQSATFLAHQTLDNSGY